MKPREPSPAAAMKTPWTLAALLLLAIAARDADAQVFLAARSHPEFAVAPLFVTATIDPADTRGDEHPLRVTLVWNVLVRARGEPHARGEPRAPAGSRAPDPPSSVAQDLFLLWPGEISEGNPTSARADEIARYVRDRGFDVKAAGTLKLRARRRTDMGTAAGFVDVADVPFVTFMGRGGRATAAVGASYLRIPWTDHFGSSDWLLRLELPLRRVITPKPVSWLEETFWGRRHIIELSFGDVGHLALYPLYFEHRDRVVPLAQDFSQLRLTFKERDHLKIEDAVPTSARRQVSESMPGAEVVAVTLRGTEGIIPQTLKVQFAYFSGTLAWRPILISLLFLVLGNVTGPIVTALARRLLRKLRARVHVGRAAEVGRGRERGVILSPDTVARLAPGETTRDDVLRLCGPEAEERERLGPDGRRILVYRGERVVPKPRRAFGWLTTVSHWDLESHEVEIELEHDRVRDVRAHVRRTRLLEPEATSR